MRLRAENKSAWPHFAAEKGRQISSPIFWLKILALSNSFLTVLTVAPYWFWCVSGLDTKQYDLILLLRKGVEFRPHFDLRFWPFPNLFSLFWKYLHNHSGMSSGRKQVSMTSFCRWTRASNFGPISTEDFGPFQIFSRYLESISILILVCHRAGNKSAWPHFAAEKGRQISPPIFRLTILAFCNSFLTILKIVPYWFWCLSGLEIKQYYHILLLRKIVPYISTEDFGPFKILSHCLESISILILMHCRAGSKSACLHFAAQKGVEFRPLYFHWRFWPFPNLFSLPWKYFHTDSDSSRGWK